MEQVGIRMVRGTRCASGARFGGGIGTGMGGGREGGGAREGRRGWARGRERRWGYTDRDVLVLTIPCHFPISAHTYEMFEPGLAAHTPCSPGLAGDAVSASIQSPDLRQYRQHVSRPLIGISRHHSVTLVPPPPTIFSSFRWFSPSRSAPLTRRLSLMLFINHSARLLIIIIFHSRLSQFPRPARSFCLSFIKIPPACTTRVSPLNAPRRFFMSLAPYPRPPPIVLPFAFIYPSLADYPTFLAPPSPVGILLAPSRRGRHRRGAPEASRHVTSPYRGFHPF